MATETPRLIILTEPSTGTASDLRSIAIESVRLLLDDAASPHTRRAYEGDLVDFCAAAMGEKEGVTGAAIELLLSMDVPRLTVTLRGYVTNMRRRSLSEATISRRLAAIRKLLGNARLLGAGTPDPKALVARIKVERYRDIRGPEPEEIASILEAIDRSSSIKGKRDYAILHLLYSNGLRRNEVLGADIGDFDAGRRLLSISGKGRAGQRESVTLLPATAEAITAYLEARGFPDYDAPLFASCDRSCIKQGIEKRLTGQGLWEIVDKYGKQVLGRRLHPHAFRHTAITVGLEESGGNVPLVQEFSRHKDANTVLHYRKRSRDGQGEVTRLLGERLEQARKKD